MTIGKKLMTVNHEDVSDIRLKIYQGNSMACIPFNKQNMFS